jgi:hypothetical protein
LGDAWRAIYQGKWPKPFAQWSFYVIFFVGVMSTKPAPRYFEMVFVIALAGAALALSRIPFQRAAGIFISVFALISVTQWRANYIGPSLRHEGVDRSFRYLIFHDNSSDSLSKQSLVDELGKDGCGPTQVSTSDPRLGEALHFLARGDWQVSDEKCPGAPVKVERAATGAVGRRFEGFSLFD